MLDRYSLWFDKKKQTLLSEFSSFLRFPSVSTDPAYREDVVRCKEWLSSYLQERGFAVETWETTGHPTLFASSLGAGPTRPTLLFYQHYDVQPVDPIDEWITGPFDPTVRAGKIYARGAIDNKGQCFYVIAALAAFLEHAGTSQLNLKIVIEGEEEMGSPGFAAVLKEKKQELKADHVFIVDCEMPAQDQPAVTLGVRGLMSLEITCRNSAADLHSGCFGGVVLNPARALIKALSACFDQQGHIAVPGFYDDVRLLSAEEKTALDFDPDVKASAAALKVGAFASEEGYSLVESNWIRPTLEINGLESGYTGAGVKTIIPAQARAKLSCRLVPDQNPVVIGNLLAPFLKKKLPQGIDIEMDVRSEARAFTAALRGETVEKAVQACEDVFQKPCRRILTGATIPIAADLAATSGGNLVLMGVGLSEDQMHAPNESFALDRLKQGFLVIARLLEIFAQGR
ncbi:MAG: M20/M25/M40 family metallo-hydrolase [Chlamydiota bacterium]